MKRTKKNRAKKRILGLLALMLVAVIGVGSGLAYLTDYDEATNKFTLGDIDTPMEEPNWKNPVKAVTEINGDTAGKPDRSGDEVYVGDVLTYSITATNGDIEAHDIVITDTIEAGLDVDTASISHGGTYDSATRTITWTIANVAKLSDVTVYFKATVNEAAVEHVDNDAWAKVGNEDAKQTNKVTNPLTEDPKDPTKKVSDTSETGKNGATVTVGDLITYEITFYNNADVAGTVTVTDPLDEQVEYVSSSDGGTEAGGIVTWTFANMPAHSSKTITLTVKVISVKVGEALDPITNQATTQDPSNTYTTNIVTNPVRTPETPKQPEKTYTNDTAAGFNGAKVNVGDVITYKIQYYNHETEAVSVVITDTLEAGLSVDTTSISNGGTYDPATRTITWNIASAPAQTNGFVTFSATVNEDAVVKVVNDAYVTIGDNETIKTNKLVNPIEETTTPGDTEIKDPTVTAAEGDSFMRMKVEFLDGEGNRITDIDRINKIIDTLYYDTSYVYQGSVSDPSTLTTNIVKGESYSAADLAAMVASGVVFKEFNSILFEYDTTRTADPAVRYYNYTANNGIFNEGSVATLFTNVVFPTDWNGSDFDVLGTNYLIRVTSQACQIDGLTQAEAYAALDAEAPNP